ncbi:MAG: bifunctional precorrin-2 dehydrogenase/sirohydrochlorin ferrochelatase [Chloroflexi bacterium]|nr:bifunctional precorrin-2 dehydrogenase/sirohydrochlorin ferrochelatase [Chloroflexota bacterium]
MAPYYPAFLDVKDRLCVIIGGGQIAEGKIASLLECGAKIKMISPEVTSEVQGMADADILRLEKREYQVGDMEGAFLAIAATDDTDVNRQITQEAETRNVLLNVVDITHLCTFIAPSVVRKGDVTVAISTAGLSPALARKLREELEVSPILDYADMAPMLSEVRLELRQEGAVVPADHWQTCLNQEVLALYHSDKIVAKKTLKEALLQGVSSKL